MVHDRTQAGELTAILQLLDEDTPPYIVDVGAHDGTTISNSAYFIKQGWHGIVIEPLHNPYHLLEEKYSGNQKVKCLNIACSDEPGVQKLFIGRDGYNGMLGTLCTDENEYFRTVRTNLSITVVVDTLTNVLDDAGFPPDFSVLLIDTEGMDYEVLGGLDFQHYQPRVIVTEEYKWNAEKQKLKYKLLENKGYLLDREVGCNTIWIREYR